MFPFVPQISYFSRTLDAVFHVCVFAQEQLSDFSFTKFHFPTFMSRRGLLNQRSKNFRKGGWVEWHIKKFCEVCNFDNFSIFPSS